MSAAVGLAMSSVAVLCLVAFVWLSWRKREEEDRARQRQRGVADRLTFRSQFPDVPEAVLDAVFEELQSRQGKAQFTPDGEDDLSQVYGLNGSDVDDLLEDLIRRVAPARMQEARRLEGARVRTVRDVVSFIQRAAGAFENEL